MLPQPVAISNKQLLQMILHTNCGNITISTQNHNAPITHTAIAYLAENGFYDKSLCHRLTTSGLYILQCGDPTATGSGAPVGWSGYQNENLPSEVVNNYPAGTVAMTNTGPNTNGSQFFFTHRDTTLNSNYTIWGSVSSGLDIIKHIAVQGVKGGGNDGQPIPVSINSIELFYAPTSNPTAVEKVMAEAKAAADLRAAAEAADKPAAELKAKQEAEAKAAAELKAKQEAEAKAAAELKAKQEAQAAAVKAASELKAKQLAEAKAAVLKKITITCIKGKLAKKITAVKPKSPNGYRKKRSND
jgi:cyclophilin family peptidyl-prolyl cis-trans isomerase